MYFPNFNMLKIPKPQNLRSVGEVEKVLQKFNTDEDHKIYLSRLGEILMKHIMSKLDSDGRKEKSENTFTFSFIQVLFLSFLFFLNFLCLYLCVYICIELIHLQRRIGMISKRRQFFIHTQGNLSLFKIRFVFLEECWRNDI